MKLFLKSVDKKLPSTASQNDTTVWENVVSQHLEQEYHAKSVEAFDWISLNVVKKLQTSKVGQYISSKNEVLANKIGSLLIHT